MTTRRGGGKRGQRYQNSWAYKPGLHKTGKKASLGVSSLQLETLCHRCREIIQWKIKFDKYKPLSAPRKWCVPIAGVFFLTLSLPLSSAVCGCPKVKLAYRKVCGVCCGESDVCGKCGQQLTETDVDSSHSEHKETPG